MKRFKYLLCAAALCALAPLGAFADTVTVNGTNSSQNTDNTNIPASGPGSLVTLTLEYGTCNTDNTFNTPVGTVPRPAVAPGANFSETLNLAPGKTCIRAYLTNTFGSVSSPSNVTTRVVAAPVPKPPTLAANSPLVMTMKHMSYGWAAYDNVGRIALRSECNPDLSYDNGFFGVKNRSDVTFYPGREKTTLPLAVQCTSRSGSAG
jgi:hypothetical protein